jgi:hypothetical protein
VAMIERSADAWEHNQFKDVVVRVANIEMYVLLCLYWSDIHSWPAITALCPSTSKKNRTY